MIRTHQVDAVGEVVMSKLPGQSWWSSIGFGVKGAVRDEDDFADMGTAFGLDASLQGDAEPEPPESKRALEREAPSGSAPGSSVRSRR